MKKVSDLNEGLEMDMMTYKKIKGTLDPKTPIKITGDKPAPTTGVMEDSDVLNNEQPNNTIQPQDFETIKYLSNVKDSNTGEISKPFTINDKSYQIVRGVKPNKETVICVYSCDELNDAGENIIYPTEYFEENIAKKAVTEGGYDYATQEREFHDKEAFMDYLNLTDLVGFKHFFVNLDSGEIVAKFKNTKEMIKSGIKLGPREDYMDIKGLKRFRFGEYFKGGDINEESPTDTNTGGTDVGKLKSDVKKLTNMIKTKFSMYLSKLEKPIEQAQFLTSMAQEIGVPLNKLSSIITTFKDIAGAEVPPAPVVKEGRVIKKKDLVEGVNDSLKPKVIKTVKVKDIK